MNNKEHFEFLENALGDKFTQTKDGRVKLLVDMLIDALYIPTMGEHTFKDIDKLVVPIYPEWIEYKGEVYVSQLNFEATERAGKPMFDLSYCMTKALNQCILKTVQYDKNKFKVTLNRN